MKIKLLTNTINLCTQTSYSLKAKYKNTFLSKSSWRAIEEELNSDQNKSNVEWDEWNKDFWLTNKIRDKSANLV